MLTVSRASVGTKEAVGERTDDGIEGEGQMDVTNLLEFFTDLKQNNGHRNDLFRTETYVCHEGSNSL